MFQNVRHGISLDIKPLNVPEIYSKSVCDSSKRVEVKGSLREARQLGEKGGSTQVMTNTHIALTGVRAIFGFDQSKSVGEV